MKNTAKWILIFAERIYLWAHGWRSLPESKYLPPADYPFEKKADYVRVHAVNAQRQVYAKKTKELKGETLGN